MRIINYDSKHNRAIALGQDARDWYFGLVVKRLNPDNSPYWCFYVQATDEEVDRAYNWPDSECFSFGGIANDTICVPGSLAASLMLEPPTHFLGVHIHPNQIPNVSQDSVLNYLEGFCKLIRGRLHEG